MQIRAEQLEAFRPRADELLAARVVEHLRENHPEEVGRLPDDVLAEMVSNGLARARRYGLTLESSLTAFVVLMFVVAPNFDEHPLIRHVLTDESEPPDRRVDALAERISEANWEEAERRYDPGAWFPELSEGAAREAEEGRPGGAAQA